MSANQNLSFVLNSVRHVSFESRGMPCISSPHDVLIRVTSTGICGSDAHYYNHGRIGAYEVKSPMVLGHESAGVVVEVGSSVTTVKVGDRVAMEPGIPCRYCRYCHKGTYHLCRGIRFAATPPFDGTLCDIYRLPEDFCHKLPDSISLDEGALAEPLSVAVHVMSTQAKVKLGDEVVVFGAGPIGLLCCAVARAYGAEKIVVADINKSRLEFAKEYAATTTFDATTISPYSAKDGAEMLAKQIDLHEDGADVVVDATGAESSIQLGVRLTKPGGTFVQAGMGKDDITFPIAAVCGKEITVKGSFRYGAGDYETAINLMAFGKVDTGRLITKVVPFQEAEQAFKSMGSGIKTIIRGPQATEMMIGAR